MDIDEQIQKNIFVMKFYEDFIRMKKQMDLLIAKSICFFILRIISFFCFSPFSFFTEL